MNERTGRKTLFQPSACQRGDARTMQIHFLEVRQISGPQDRTATLFRQAALDSDGHRRMFAFISGINLMRLNVISSQIRLNL
jgi:hypothetical protein